MLVRCAGGMRGPVRARSFCGGRVTFVPRHAHPLRLPAVAKAERSLARANGKKTTNISLSMCVDYLTASGWRAEHCTREDLQNWCVWVDICACSSVRFLTLPSRLPPRSFDAMRAGLGNDVFAGVTVRKSSAKGMVTYWLRADGDNVGYVRLSNFDGRWVRISSLPALSPPAHENPLPIRLRLDIVNNGGFVDETDFSLGKSSKVDDPDAAGRHGEGAVF